MEICTNGTNVNIADAHYLVSFGAANALPLVIRSLKAFRALPVASCAHFDINVSTWFSLLKLHAI